MNYLNKKFYWLFGYGTVIENIFLVKNSGQVYD